MEYYILNFKHNFNNFLKTALDNERIKWFEKVMNYSFLDDQHTNTMKKTTNNKLKLI